MSWNTRQNATMAQSPQGQPLDAEEALLAAQQKFLQGKEALSVQLRIKRPPKQSGTPESTKKALKPTGVTWAPDVTGGEEAAASHTGAEASAERDSDRIAEEDSFSGGGQESPAKSAQAPAEVSQKPIKVLASISTGPSVHAAHSEVGEQLHQRIGAGADLTGDDEDSDSETDDSGVDRLTGDDGRPPYEPLPTVGAIKEKGYGGKGFNAFAPAVPAPRVTPFPEARHRSEGPHWGPVSRTEVARQPLDPDSAPPFDPASAIPLSRSAPAKTKASISKFRQALLETRNQERASNKVPSEQKPLITDLLPTTAEALDTGPEFRGTALGEDVGSGDQLPELTYGDQAAQRTERAGKVEQSHPRKSAGVSDEDVIDTENRARLAAMTSAEVAAEQAELQQMLPPGVLEALRKRGAQKLGKSTPDNPSKSRSGLNNAFGVVREQDEEPTDGSAPRDGKIRRQPTPLPGAIPPVRSAPLDDLGAISEAEDETDGLNKVVRFAADTFDQGAGKSRGAIRRQPTPFPSAIPVVQAEPTDGLEAIDEVGMTEDSGSVGAALTGGELRRGSPVKGGSLQRRSTPLQGAIPAVRKPPTNALGAIGEGEPTEDAVRQDASPSRGGEGPGALPERSGLRRQPTPLPGTIPPVQRGHIPVLGAVSEMAESLSNTEASKMSGRPPPEDHTGGVSLRRQPTPLPGAIPSAVKRGGSELPVLAVEESDESANVTAAEGALTGQRLLRQPTPMPGAFLPKQQEVQTGEGLGSVAEMDEEAASAMGDGVASRSGGGSGRGKARGMPGPVHGRGTLHRQPTPMPGAIPTGAESFNPELDGLEETTEEEGDGLGKSDYSEASKRKGGRLKRQPTPFPSAIAGSLADAGPGLAAVDEEAEEGSGPEDVGIEPGAQIILGGDQAPLIGTSAHTTDTVPEVSPHSFEAVHVSKLRFGLDGSLLSPEERQGPGNADVSTAGDKAVAQRDILRSEGDPSGAGYTLREAAALARSTVPGQRAAALWLLAAVLKRAITGIGGGRGGGNAGETDRGASGGVWARVWEYALGPELQLAVLLRSALDDSHASVLAAATLALSAALTCDENEALFEDRSALWTGPEEPASVFTGPCERSWGVLTAGVGNWGRWAVKASVSVGAQNDGGGESEETVGDDARVAAADLVAGLIRMGVLPRIRFILEVLSLPALDEPLLSVLLAFCRHSPAAGTAVRDCPRLLPTLQSVFVGLPASEVRPAIPNQTAQAKAVKLLGVLALAGRPSADAICSSGLLQLAKRHLFSAAQGPPHYPPAFPEVLHLWRICALYGLGGSSLSDYYAPLSFVLEAPTSTGVKRAGSSDLWKESAEAYLLLEALARTLLSDRDTETTGADGNEGREVLMDWRTVGPLVETAAHWLIPSLVGSLVEARELRGGVACAPRLRALAAVVHFLATVCERNEGQLGRLERTVVDALLAKGGLLVSAESSAGLKGDAGMPGEESMTANPATHRQTVSAFRTLSNTAVAAGDKSVVLAPVSCLQGLLRLTSALAARERMGARVPGSATKGAKNPGRTGDEKEGYHEEPRVGPIEAVLAKHFGDLALRMTERFAVSSAGQKEEEEGDNAAVAGVGLGWGRAGRGVWTDAAEVKRARAELLARLYQTLPLAAEPGSAFASEKRAARLPEEEPAAAGTSKAGQSGSVDGEGDGQGDGEGDGKRNGESRLALRRLRAGLAAVRHARPGDFALVLSLLSSCVLDCKVLTGLLSEGTALRASIRQHNESGSGSVRQGRTDLPSAAEVRRVLLPHFASQWLGRTGGGADVEGDVDGSENRWDMEREVGRVLEADAAGLPGDLTPVSGALFHRSMPTSRGLSMAVAVAGQKLPLPADWILSSTAVAAQLALGAFSEATSRDFENGVKRLVRAGLALLLGLEAAERLELPSEQSERSGRTFLRFPLARKLHALSEVFLAPGELFLDPDIGPLLDALQSLYGKQIPEGQRACRDVGSEASASGMAAAASGQPHPGLDFAMAVGAPYESFAESLAEHFAATSFGDAVFGRQVALLLRTDVTPGSLRLVVWRALADAGALHLLPPAKDCMGGDPGAYLALQEESKEALELYAAALSSGALDRTIASGSDAMSLSALIALHHLRVAVANSGVNKPLVGSVRGHGSGSNAAEAPTDARRKHATAEDKKRCVRGLARGLLRSIAGGRCEATALAALVSPSLALAANRGLPVEREKLVAALFEVAAGDNALVGVIEGTLQ